MVKFIYGKHNAERSNFIIEMIKSDAQSGKHSFLIVPEQRAVSTERRVLETLPKGSLFSVEVLNFSRLYNRVCRVYGGLEYNYVTNPLRHLFMWQTLKNTAPALERYGSLVSKDKKLVNFMLGCTVEFKNSGVTPEMLDKVLNSLDKDNPLYSKLADINMIYTAYSGLVGKNFSDFSDDIQKLSKILEKNNFFTDTNVYIDSFFSYTAPEHSVIEKIFRQADNVYVSIPLKSVGYESIATARINTSEKRLRSSAFKWGGCEDIILSEKKNSAIRFLSDNLWETRAVIPQPEIVRNASETIVLESCPSLYAEAEAAVLHICDLLRNGVRARDISIVVRNCDRYLGYIDQSLERNRIPYFISEKSDLSAMSVVKHITSALRIKIYNRRKEDVIANIKSGLYSFPQDKIDLFESYINTWNITGKGFFAPEFKKNPDGYSETPTARGIKILSAANEIKNSLFAVLDHFYTALDNSKNTAEMCFAVYNFLESANVSEMLEALAAKETSNGNSKDAAELRGLYSTTLNAIASVGESIGDEILTIPEFLQALECVFENTDIGTIPTSVDQIIISDASMPRMDNPKYVFVLGLCEGEFPASVDGDGFFAESEISELAEFDIKLESDMITRSSDELLFVQNAFSAPAKRLYLFTNTAGGRVPSLPFMRVKKLFTDLYVHNFRTSDIMYLIGTPENTLPCYGKIGRGTILGASLAKALEKSGFDVQNILSADKISNTRMMVSDLTAKSLYGKNINMTPTFLESFLACKLKFYCEKILRLRPENGIDFKANNAGNFIHFVLENLLKEISDNKIDITALTDEEIFDMAYKEADKYISLITPDKEDVSGRIKYIYGVLRILTSIFFGNILAEVSGSSFEPAMFELSIDGKEGNPSPLTLTLPDSTAVSLSGKVDRVDLLRSDGEIYIRIIDYKTGLKNFKPEDIERGYNLQMPLYLFALCENGKEDFRQKIGLSDGKYAKPGGIAYISSKFDKIDLSEYLEDTDIYEAAKMSIVRTGFTNNKEEILLSINRDRSPDFIPNLNKKKGEEIYFADELQFEEIKRKIFKKIESVACEMKAGNAHAEPDDKISPCNYCDFKPVCRIRDDGKDAESYGK